MLQEAHRRNLPSSRIAYIQMAIEDIDFPAASFDTVISSLAFHYVASLRKTYQRVYSCLSDAGDFVFSVEHPIFTSSDRQEWHYDSSVRRHWPVDNYYREGLRRTSFLGMDVTKYHRTLTSYIEGLLKTGFQITGLIEPRPDRNFATSDAEWKDELRRPMFLLLSARKA